MSHWANSPTLRVLVDELPHPDEFIYEAKETGSGTAYYGEIDGFISFMHHSPKDESGYGGTTFTLRVKRGISDEEVKVKGPWSSNAAAMNGLGFGPCLDVSVTDDEGVWARGWTFTSGAITLEKVQEFLRKNEPEALPRYFELHFLLEEGKHYTPLPCKPQGLGRHARHGAVIAAPVELEAKD
jgi:hypothetical protein